MKTLVERVALTIEDTEDATFERHYTNAYLSGDWETIARQLSTRLRQMDKRAKAANKRIVILENELRHANAVLKAATPDPKKDTP